MTGKSKEKIVANQWNRETKKFTIEKDFSEA